MYAFRFTFEDGSHVYLRHSELTDEQINERHYAFPDKRKFPLPDKPHVLSAIRFFNYVSPKDEKVLAKAILKRMRELGMGRVNVGETNRFKKYYNPEGGYLAHYGVQGMKWGIWNKETRAKYTGNGYSKAMAKAADKYQKREEKFLKEAHRIKTSGGSQRKFNKALKKGYNYGITSAYYRSIANSGRSYMKQLLYGLSSDGQMEQRRLNTAPRIYEFADGSNYYVDRKGSRKINIY